MLGLLILAHPEALISQASVYNSSGAIAEGVYLCCEVGDWLAGRVKLVTAVFVQVVGWRDEVWHACLLPRRASPSGS